MYSPLKTKPTEYFRSVSETKFCGRIIKEVLLRDNPKTSYDYFEVLEDVSKIMLSYRTENGKEVVIYDAHTAQTEKHHIQFRTIAYAGNNKVILDMRRIYDLVAKTEVDLCITFSQLIQITNSTYCFFDVLDSVSAILEEADKEGAISMSDSAEDELSTFHLGFIEEVDDEIQISSIVIDKIHSTYKNTCFGLFVINETTFGKILNDHLYLIRKEKDTHRVFKHALKLPGEQAYWFYIGNSLLLGMSYYDAEDSVERLTRAEFARIAPSGDSIDLLFSTNFPDVSIELKDIIFREGVPYVCIISDSRDIIYIYDALKNSIFRKEDDAEGAILDIDSEILEYRLNDAGKLFRLYYSDDCAFEIRVYNLENLSHESFTVKGEVEEKGFQNFSEFGFLRDRVVAVSSEGEYLRIME